MSHFAFSDSRYLLLYSCHTPHFRQQLSIRKIRFASTFSLSSIVSQAKLFEHVQIYCYRLFNANLFTPSEKCRTFHCICLSWYIFCFFFFSFFFFVHSFKTFVDIPQSELIKTYFEKFIWQNRHSLIRASLTAVLCAR